MTEEELKERELLLKEKELEIKAAQAQNRPMSGGEAAVTIFGALIQIVFWGIVVIIIGFVILVKSGH